MIADDRTGYGMRDGQLLFITDVPSGLNCGCVCVRCGQQLVAKKGLKRRHHFAHFAISSCHGAAESVLHILAKDLLAELDAFAVPQYDYSRQRRTKSGALVRHDAVVVESRNVEIRNVRVETYVGDFVPDIVVESDSTSWIVEVAVTHKVARAKLCKIRRRDLPAIEIRLSASDSLLSRDALKSKLKHDLPTKVWLFHPAQREAERTFLSKFRDELARARKAVRPPIIPRRRAIRSSSAGRLASPHPWREYDRVGDDFKRKNGRYPTVDECRALWPRLYQKRDP